MRTPPETRRRPPGLRLGKTSHPPTWCLFPECQGGRKRRVHHRGVAVVQRRDSAEMTKTNASNSSATLSLFYFILFYFIIIIICLLPMCRALFIQNEKADINSSNTTNFIEPILLLCVYSLAPPPFTDIFYFIYILFYFYLFFRICRGRPSIAANTLRRRAWNFWASTTTGDRSGYRGAGRIRTGYTPPFQQKLHCARFSSWHAERNANRTKSRVVANPPQAVVP